MNKSPSILPLLHPRYWMTWLGVGLLRSSVLLPDPALLWLGRGVGRLLMRLDKRRKNIARINLELCFPTKPAAEIERLLTEHFQAVGIGVFESALAWWAKDRRLDGWVRIIGEEHLDAARAKGKGVMLFSAHFTPLELSGRLLALAMPDLPLNAMYRPHNNALIDHLVYQLRESKIANPISKHNVRGMLSALKQRNVVWYAADQNYGSKGHVFADFFGVPAATNTAATRLAEATGAIVVPFVVRRVGSGFDYEIEMSPALQDFPTDPQTDAIRLNHIIEEWVRKAPEQYFWLHRRFKSRPGQEPRFY